MLSWLLPPMSLHTHRGGWCGREREAGLSPGGGGARPSACLPAAVPEPLLLLGCCLRPQDPAEPARGERGRLLAAAEMMAEGGGGPARRKALSLLEAARSRYESLQISDDVFGESGQDSSGNPFYSTSADSRSAASSQDEEDDEEGEGRPEGPCPRSRAARRRVPRPAAAPAERRRQQQRQAGGGGGAVPGGPGPMEEGEEEEDAETGGWTRSLRDVPPPRFKDSSGTRGNGGGRRGLGDGAAVPSGHRGRGCLPRPARPLGCRAGCGPCACLVTNVFPRGAERGQQRGAEGLRAGSSRGSACEGPAHRWGHAGNRAAGSTRCPRSGATSSCEAFRASLFHPNRSAWCVAEVRS